jgi:hypothetical protein
LHAASTERSQDSATYTFAEVILISGHEKVVNPVSPASINLGIWFYEVETGDTSESIEPEEATKHAGFR